MTELCVHGITARNCYSCFTGHTASRDTRHCPGSCWCRKFPKAVSMSDMYEAIKPLNERISALEYSRDETLKLANNLSDLVINLGNTLLKIMKQ